MEGAADGATAGGPSRPDEEEESLSARGGAGSDPDGALDEQPLALPTSALGRLQLRMWLLFDDPGSSSAVRPRAAANPGRRAPAAARASRTPWPLSLL